MQPTHISDYKGIQAWRIGGDEQLDCGTMNVIIHLTIILKCRLLGFSSWSFRACDHEKTQL